MTPIIAVPFHLRRSTDIVNALEVTTTTESVHGVARLQDACVRIQWRLSRTTDHVGMEIRSDREVEPVREASIPFSGFSAARVRMRWWRWPWGAELVLTAAELAAFDEIAGSAGLRLEHPAEIVLRIRRTDLAAARTFAAELELALADHVLLSAEGSPEIAGGSARLPRSPHH